MATSDAKAFHLKEDTYFIFCWLCASIGIHLYFPSSYCSNNLQNWRWANYTDYQG